jgi:SAM-dependent methyltransferase
MTSRSERPEISDLIVDHDPETLARRPVRKAEVVDLFRRLGNARAARIVEALPDDGGVLVAAAVDRLLIRVHAEIQRLSEEFEHGQRMLEILAPLRAALDASGVAPPFRIVDVGCGTGYVVRWLAANAGVALGHDVAFVGADLNGALVEEAKRLAAAEGLACAFVQANAFRIAEPATVYISTGVLHHFRGESLDRFLAQHELPSLAAFFHFDFQPSLLSPIGAWLMHVARMREPLSMHDGVLSALRAHTGPALLAAARRAAPSFATTLYGTRFGPLPRAFHTLVGIRPHRKEAFERALGRRASRLGAW